MPGKRTASAPDSQSARLAQQDLLLLRRAGGGGYPSSTSVRQSGLEFAGAEPGWGGTTPQLLQEEGRQGAASPHDVGSIRRGGCRGEAEAGRACTYLCML